MITDKPKTNADNKIVDVSAKSSPMAMPKQCQAQLDIYKKALAEEEAEVLRT